MEKIWLDSYQPGVPAEINPEKFISLNSMFIECFSLYKDLPAFSNMGQTVTYAVIEKQAQAFAMYLRKTLNLEKGAHIAIMLPNVMQFPVCVIGALFAGCSVVTINPLYTPAELVFILKDSEAQTIIVLENFAYTVAKVLEQTQIKRVIITKIGDIFPKPKASVVNFLVKYIKRMIPKWHIKSFDWYTDALKKGAAFPFEVEQLTGADIAFLQYTGGTTGKNKAACLTHRNMVASLEQGFAWLSTSLTPGKEIVVTALPLYHILSLSNNFLSFFRLGGLNVLITDPRDIKRFIKDLSRFKFTFMTGVNTLFTMLLAEPEFSKLDFSGLKFTFGGGMPIQQEIAHKWQEVTKCPLLEAFGLTECSPGVSINPLNISSYNATVGIPVPSTEISIRDENKNEVAIGMPGELWVRGPQVMLGYWKQPEETANVFDEDGWLRTGDVVSIDAKGFLRVVDRIKDAINVSGFKVYPSEVEQVIAKMQGIVEVCVVGVADPDHGEVVKAYIVTADPKIDEESVKNFCRQHLTNYKLPHLIEFRTSLPKSNVGKILRSSL